MSAFGHNTFRQDLHEEIKYLADKYCLNKADAVIESMNVVAYFADEVYRNIHKEIADSVQESVRQSLIERLK